MMKKTLLIVMLFNGYALQAHVAVAKNVVAEVRCIAKTTLKELKKEKDKVGLPLKDSEIWGTAIAHACEYAGSKEDGQPATCRVYFVPEW